MMEREEGEIENSGNRSDGEKNKDYVEELRKEKAITFYVSNIHPHISDSELWIECMNYGHVVDAYIARKRDKRGNRFGFLRFIKIKDVEKMTKALCQMSFYGWKIRANVARFVKIEKKSRKQETKWIRKEEGHVNTNGAPVAPNNVYKSNGVSWADVVAGRQSQQEEDRSLNFTNESQAYKLWRGRAVIGDLISIEALRDVNNMKKKLRLKDSQVRYLGGMKLLIIFDSVEEMEGSMKKDMELWNLWFKILTTWNGEYIPYERIAWLRIRGIPLQLWINEVFNVVGEYFGKVIKKSDADEKDLCFNDDTIGIIVNHGAEINEKIKIRWKHLVYEVWVSEVHHLWFPEFISESVNEDNTTKEQEEQATPTNTEAINQPEIMESEESTIPVPENERPQNSPVENEKLEKEHEKVGADFLGDEANEFNAPLNVEAEVTCEDNKTTELSGTPIVGDRNTNGPDMDHNIGPSTLTHKKRKRISLAEARTNYLKPQSKVGKNKLPDLNIDLSDESRPRPKRRILLKKGRTNRRRYKGKARLTEEEFNNYEVNDDCLEDEYDSDWEIEDNTETHQETETPTVEIQGVPKEIEKDEVEATLGIGLKIGIDLTGNEAILKKAIEEDQVDARIQ
ncbi:putative RNA recognition motif domain, nucleotide-binding alpha-beta plait domain superfamily [Helianthus annuus]|nr:putative RNA recognition motif domain, nucleotide-binding alpha-beta plait domain superfamily [Helianthus annuus]